MAAQALRQCRTKKSWSNEGLIEHELREILLLSTLAEIFNISTRARWTAVSIFTNMSAYLIFAQCSPLAFPNLVTSILSHLSCGAGMIIWFFYPEEQKCLTLESVAKTSPTRQTNDRASTQTETSRDDPSSWAGKG